MDPEEVRRNPNRFQDLSLGRRASNASDEPVGRQASFSSDALPGPDNEPDLSIHSSPVRDDGSEFNGSHHSDGEL